MGIHTETSPFTELLAILNLDQGDLVLVAESGDKLLVGILLAVLVEDAHVSLTTVKSLGSLAETTGKTVVHESQLQDALESILNGHLTLGGIAGNLDLLDDLGNVVVFYVRLWYTVSDLSDAHIIASPLLSRIHNPATTAFDAFFPLWRSGESSVRRDEAVLLRAVGKRSNSPS